MTYSVFIFQLCGMQKKVKGEPWFEAGKVID